PRPGLLSVIFSSPVRHAALPAIRSHRPSPRPAGRALVWTDVSTGIRAGLAAGPPAHRPRPDAADLARSGRSHLLLRAGRRRRRSPGLCALLQTVALPEPPAGDPVPVAGRHVVSWRPDRRARGAPAVFPQAQAAHA